MYGVRSLSPNAVALAVAVILSTPAGATTIIVPTDDALIAKSPAIAAGRVVRSEAIASDGRIVTETELAVEDVLKGTVGARVIIREAGGDYNVTEVLRELEAEML